jgi:hypothetical protein
MPVLWQSKLQTETALSTLEAEIIALAAYMRELIPIMDTVASLAVAVGLTAGDVNMKVSVHEDNLGALVLAETLPHNSPLTVSITPSKQFGFKRRFINGVLSF